MGKIDEEQKKMLLETSAMGYEHSETRKLLDQLRATRRARGGVGAPLQVPGHLRDAAAGQGIIITDADLSPNTRPNREEQQDLDSDLAQRINEAEKE